MNPKKRLSSRWKYIFVFKDEGNESNFYELDELGKIPRGAFQPKKISIIKKHNSIDEDIKEMFIKYPYIFYHPLLSFSGNIEIFTTKKWAENNITTLDTNSNKTENENENENGKTSKNLANKQSIHDELFNSDTEKDQKDDEIDDYFRY